MSSPLRFAHRAASLILLAAACGGTSSTGVPAGDGGSAATSGDANVAPPPGSGAADGATAPDTGASADGGPLTCAQVRSQYAALGSTPAYVSCATGADCTIVSSDVCYRNPTLALNAAGVAAANALGDRWQQLGECGVMDCGSGGGGGLTPGCPAGKCVALLADGGIAPP